MAPSITYRSTRGGATGLSFEQAVFEGLAPDGGLMVPETVPDVSATYKSWSKLSFHELAFEVASLFCSTDEVPAADLRSLMQRSYKTFDHEDVVPSIKVNDLYVMELFHGPTFAFKDVALQVGIQQVQCETLQTRKTNTSNKMGDKKNVIQQGGKLLHAPSMQLSQYLYSRKGGHNFLHRVKPPKELKRNASRCALLFVMVPGLGATISAGEAFIFVDWPVAFATGWLNTTTDDFWWYHDDCRVNTEPPNARRAVVKAPRLQSGGNASLVAVVRPWGQAFWAFEGATADAPLWQVQVAGMARNMFSYSIIVAAREALPSRPNPEVKLILMGSGILPWQTCVYAAGETPVEALKFIHFILSHPVQHGILPAMPELSVEVIGGNLGSLPEPCVLNETPVVDPAPKPFSVVPPRGRRHVLAQLEQKAVEGEDSQAREEEQDDEEQQGGSCYVFSVFGGIYPCSI
eukprot:symbB.v1.2.001539.t1/scaffold72.1/size350636/10